MKPNDPTIYLICGKARTGKDTLCDLIMEELKKQNKKVAELKHSKYIKGYAMDFFGWDGCEETKPRDLLNVIGDIIRNDLNQKFFMGNRLCEDAKILSYFFDSFVVSDARFKNEVNLIKNSFKNVKTIHLIRSGNYDDGLTEEQRKHITEIDLDDYNEFDYTIDNNGSLEDLREKTTKLINN